MEENNCITIQFISRRANEGLHVSYMCSITSPLVSPQSLKIIVTLHFHSLFDFFFLSVFFLSGTGVLLLDLDLQPTLYTYTVL